MNFNLWDGVLRKVNLSRQNVLVMKLCCFFMIIGCLQIHAAGSAQRVSLSFKQASLESVLKEIKSQTGLLYWCDQQVLKQAKPISIDLRDVELAQALRACLKDQKLSFSIDDQVIVISPTLPDKRTDRDETSLLAVFPVTGVVHDAEGLPVADVSVSVKGSKTSTSTDGNGKFSLNVNVGDVLIFTSIGFEKTEVTIKNTSSLTITLSKSISTLDDVQIIAYGQTSKRFLVGNISTVKAADIEKSPVQNPLLALQGRVPGVEITQMTGMNGGAVKMRIQGQNSIVNSNDPLIVVDGVPFPSQLVGNDPTSGLENVVQGGSPLNYINPNNIESIDILKDADATSIYGSRAANGAILITTKKGVIGQPKLMLNLQQGWGEVNHFVKMLNARQYLDMRYEALRNDNIMLSTLTPDYNSYDLKTWDTTRYTNWQKELLGGTAQYSNYQAGVSGGSALMQYLVGASFNRQTVVFPGDFDNKTGSLHFNINGGSANKRFKLQLTGSYLYDQNHLPGVDLTSQALLLEPIAPSLYNSDGTLNWAPDASGRSTWTNPLAGISNSNFNNTTKNMVSNMSISYRVIPGVDFQTRIGYTSTQAELFWPFRLEINAPEYRIYSVRSTSFGNRNASSWIVDPQIQYSGKVGKGRIEALVATSIQKSSYTYLAMDASGFLNDLLMRSLKAATSTSIRNSVSGITRFNALFGRIGLNWDDKYLFNLTARRDGSNKFGANNRFNNFGSIGIGWIFSSEKWIDKSLPFLSFGKFRFSYGTTGNDGIPDFSYLSIYNINNPTILYQNSIGLNASRIPNPSVQWEETRKWQGGVDIGLFKDRILLGITYARNHSSNQLMATPISSTSGFNSVTKNVAALVENVSWEATLSTINFRFSNFSWNTNFNLTIPRNNLLSYPNANNANFDPVAIGQPLGFNKVVQFAGVNPANGTYITLNKDGNPILGNPVFEDQIIKISSLTEYYGGFLNSLKYKGLQLDFLFQFVRKRGPKDMYYFNGSKTPGEFLATTGGSNQPLSVLGRWQKPGDMALISGFSTFTTSTTFNLSDAWYSYEASFVRLKNISLSWQVPLRFVKKANIHNLRFYAHAQNLLTITKYRGLDPETTSLASLPPLRIITVGVALEF